MKNNSYSLYKSSIGVNTQSGNCDCSKQGDKIRKKEKEFYCPMKCEGERTYDTPGICPMCYMVLEEMDRENTHSLEHQKNQGYYQLNSIDQNKSLPIGAFYCPMRCEGEKTYDNPGNCTVCGMHLKKEEGTNPTEEVIYTCPMHSEIRKDQPGDCPKCGMTLVPEKGEEPSEEEKAYKQMVKKFWIAFVLSVPVLVIAMSEFIPFLNLELIAPKKVWNWLEFGLATPVLFYSSWDFFRRGWGSIIRWMPNMWTLISIGVGAAYIFSVVALLLPDLFPPQFQDAGGNVHIYFEAVAVILTLVLLGQVLEQRAHSKTNSAIKALLGLVPPVARVIRNGEEQEIPLEEVVAGDILKVKPGEKIPVDGVINDGTAVIDESMINGEPIPSEKEKGDGVLS